MMWLLMLLISLFATSCAAFTKPIVAPGAAGSRLIQYSTLLGAHGGHLYTEDNGVLMQSTSQVVILPARVEASRARYVAEGLDDGVIHSSILQYRFILGCC